MAGGVAENELIVRSPYDGSEVGRAATRTAADVEAAVAAARRVMKDDPLSQSERAALLDEAARRIAVEEDRLARTIAAEAAKPLKQARVEAQRAVSTFTFAAVEARKLAGEIVPVEASDVGAGKLAFTLRVPVGVVGGITPFNFPLNLVAHKVAPAIAAGCPIVVKPASQTPLSALALRDLLREVGLPDAWFEVLPGKASEVGNTLVDHPDVPLITFTGSVDVGWSIRERAPRKKVGLELGNNAPVIIEPDGDWRTAAAKVAVAGYSFSGQTCISVQRVLVNRAVHEPFVTELVGQVAALVVGDPADEGTQVSSLINEAAAERVAGWIDEAVSAGASVRTGGGLEEHSVVAPCVLDGVTPDLRVSHSEVFGPVVGVQAYDTFDEALALANDTRYGLQAGVFTADLAKALLAGEVLDFGGVLVNEVPTWRADHMPYGGLRDSGNTREGPLYAAQEMTERRLVVLSA